MRDPSLEVVASQTQSIQKPYRVFTPSAQMEACHRASPLTGLGEDGGARGPELQLVAMLAPGRGGSGRRSRFFNTDLPRALFLGGAWGFLSTVKAISKHVSLQMC